MSSVDMMGKEFDIFKNAYYLFYHWFAAWPWGTPWLRTIVTHKFLVSVTCWERMVLPPSLYSSNSFYKNRYEFFIYIYIYKANSTITFPRKHHLHYFYLLLNLKALQRKWFSWDIIREGHHRDMANQILLIFKNSK